MIKINIKGIDKTKAFLSKKRKNISKGTQEGLKKAAFFMQGEVKQSIAGHRNEPTSVDTGRFLNSVDLEVGKDDAVIFTNISYAKFLEFGTSSFRPRRHFQNSKSRNQNKVTELIKKSVKDKI
jgi:phage gpG-like protein